MMNRSNRSPIHRVSTAAASGCLLLLGASLALAQPGDERANGDRPSTLTVSASADVSVMPDQAVVRLGVVGQAEDAAEAQDQVNAIMQQVTDAVTALDVPEQQIRTEDLSLYPVYSESRPQPAGREPEEPRITGYRASNVVSIEVNELARVGEVIDAGIMAGANQLQGVSFQLRNDAAGRTEALRLAVEEARDQAQAIAAAMDVQLGGVREVIAGGYDVRPPMPLGDIRFARAEAASTPVQPGQVDITASVTVTYYLTGGAN